MDSNKIKSTLKEAREAIKQKDYKEAVKLCKSVLVADRNNYNGLVLLGVALQDEEHKDQAENAFKKAINIAPDQLLAYQGLSAHYEKQDSSRKKQMEDRMTTYHKLLSFEKNLGKFSEYCNKIVQLAPKIHSTEECIKMLSNLQYENDENYHNVVQKIILHFLLQAKDLQSQHEIMLEKMLETFVKVASNTKEETLEYYKRYLKLLYKHKKRNIFLTEAKNLVVSLPKAEFPLEWLCKVYGEEVANCETPYCSNDEIIDYCNRLFILNPVSSMAMLAKSAQLFQVRAFYESSELLKQVRDAMPQSVYPWAFLCQCYAPMHCLDDAVFCATKALALLGRQSTPNSGLMKTLQILLAKALGLQNTKESMTETIQRCHEFLKFHDGNPELIISLARAYLFIGNYKHEVTELLEAHEVSSQFNETQSAILQALYLKSERKVKESINVLNAAVVKDPNSVDLWMELGKLYSELEQHDLTLQTFLKTAKLAPYCSECFFHLGRQYSRDNKDLDKARRCFLKAVQLNPRNVEVGVCLADIYQQMGNEESYLQLLRNATKTGGAKWAWLRLGMHELHEKSYESAISSLLAAIRADPNDSHCWETLGDAYSARGSYTSALKSYLRVRELDPQALYPMFQIANIKHILGCYVESAEQFKKILAKDSSYLPALKGLGETYLCIARSYLAKQLLGCCRDYCQLAVDTLSRAVEGRRDLSCVWKLLGDVCLVIGYLPETHAMLHVQRMLIEDQSSQELLSKDSLLDLGAKCYCRALALAQDVGSLIWQDLSVNYYMQADNTTAIESKLKLREWSFAAAKKSVALNPKNWQHWNTLGIVSASHELQNYRLAQHAFIKSIQADSKNAVAWTNLGALYLKLDKVKLANKAFKMAQRADPSYIQSWIGQAMIAEATGHHDAMDLFRHTTELGMHPESCLGYAHWVCSTLQESENKKRSSDYVYCIENMHAVPVASDAMVWYTGIIKNNPSAYNMLGLLLERQGLHANAAKAFEMSLRLLDSEGNTEMQKDLVRTNYGRVLVELERYPEAIEQYQRVKEANFKTQCGLALAYFKAEMYEDSHGAYETALHWLAPNDGFKSHILVAMAAMAYMFQGVEDSQTLLYQCITLKPPSVQGLFAACALGMLHSDLNLSELVLKEFEPYKDDPNYMTDVAVFKAYTFFLQNRSVEAVRVLSSSVHRHPGQGSMWLALALLMLHDYSHQNPAVAGRCAQVAMGLGRGTMDVSKVMSLVSLSNLLSGNGASSLRTSQKAVHMFPEISENWVVLIAAHLPQCVAKQSQKETLWLKNIIDHVRRKMDTSRKMGKWLSNYERKVTQMVDDFACI